MSKALACYNEYAGAHNTSTFEWLIRISRKPNGDIRGGYMEIYGGPASVANGIHLTSVAFEVYMVILADHT